MDVMAAARLSTRITVGTHTNRSGGGALTSMLLRR